MNFFDRFLEFNEKEKLFTSGDRLLLALSGGLDSMVMAHLCLRAGFNISIAHCNFSLRGQESDGDESFVKAFAQQQGLAFMTRTFDTTRYVENTGKSIQEAARELRYAWFDELIRESRSVVSKHDPTPFSAVLTAHHADDNIETLLMNFFKGTGIQGLKGIPSKRDYIVRPLLFAWRSEITEYAQRENITFREDASNAEVYYTRNYFRHELLPGIQKVFPQVKQNLLSNLQRFQDTALIYTQGLNREKEKLMEPKGDEIHISVLKLLKCAGMRTIFYEIIREYGFSSGQLTDAVHLLYSDTGKFLLSSSHRLLRNRKHLILSPLQAGQINALVIGEKDKTMAFGERTLRIDSHHPPFDITADKNIAFLDARQIEFPIMLRVWRPGDYFYPLGMRRKKKISRFLIDEKVPLSQKENVWVLESKGRILWVLGHRIDDRFKITPHTREALRLSY